MRWKTKPEPKIGDSRWVKKFAWIPARLDSDVKVWLESYYVKQEYNKYGDFVTYSYVWDTVATVTPEEYDKLCLEEDFLTAVSTSGNFTLEKAVESYEGATRYDLTQNQKDSLKCNATYIPGADGK